MVLSNPLGDDTCDFPVHTYLKGFEKNLYAITSNAFFLLDNKGVLAAVSPPVAVSVDASIAGSSYGSLRNRKDTTADIQKV